MRTQGMEPLTEAYGTLDLRKSLGVERVGPGTRRWKGWNNVWKQFWNSFETIGFLVCGAWSSWSFILHWFLFCWDKRLLQPPDKKRLGYPGVGILSMLNVWWVLNVMKKVSPNQSWWMWSLKSSEAIAKLSKVLKIWGCDHCCSRSPPVWSMQLPVATSDFRLVPTRHWAWTGFQRFDWKKCRCLTHVLCQWKTCAARIRLDSLPWFPGFWGKNSHSRKKAAQIFQCCRSFLLKGEESQSRLVKQRSETIGSCQTQIGLPLTSELWPPDRKKANTRSGAGMVSTASDVFLFFYVFISYVFLVFFVFFVFTLCFCSGGPARPDTRVEDAGRDCHRGRSHSLVLVERMVVRVDSATTIYIIESVAKIFNFGWLNISRRISSTFDFEMDWWFVSTQ